MADSREEEHELSDSQRIAILESNVSTNRNILIVMALLALVGVSVAIPTPSTRRPSEIWSTVAA